jgi:hypothetical protein
MEAVTVEFHKGGVQDSPPRLFRCSGRARFHFIDLGTRLANAEERLSAVFAFTELL